MATILTKQQIIFIKKNRLVMSGADMSRKFGVSKSVVNSYMRKNGLAPSADIQQQFRIAATVKRLLGTTSSTPEIDAEIKELYLILPLKVLARRINKSDCFLRKRLEQLGLIIPPEITEARKQASYIKNGSIPHNKGKKMPPEVYEIAKATMFKKGNIPHNAKDRDGVIIIRNDHPERPNSRKYKWIRVSLGKWKLYHHYRWELFRGRVPKGHCLWFIDGDTMDTKLSNIECISRAENARRNKMKFESYPSELKDVIKLNNKINRKLNEKLNH